MSSAHKLGAGITNWSGSSISFQIPEVSWWG
jgi:hypothetical protein